MSKTKTKKTKAAVEDASEALTNFNPYALLDADIDAMEKKFGMNAMSIDKNEPRFSTGLIRLDLMLNGGLLGGGWYTCFGGEQSCKSTTAMTLLSSIMSMSKFKGIGSYWDYEGSSQAEYIENIMKSMGVKQNIDNVFGVKDEETGEWIVKPRVRYYAPLTGETFFDYLAKLEKSLPDKVRMGKNWYYVYENTKANQKMLKGLYDPKYFKKANKFRVPAVDGSIQAIILCDSYPAMLPKVADSKDEGDKSLALQARMFSDGIKRVKGAMRTKRIVVLGVNQLRKVPMAMYGPTETEPCGEALRFYSDVRLRMSSVSIPHGKGHLEEEPSVRVDGDDTYRYIKVKTYKNKLGGRPGQETTLRLVVNNAEGNATGFCPTWDTYQYLKATGQISGQRNKIRFLEGTPFEDAKFSWLDFKTLVEGNKEDIKDMCEQMGLKKPVLLRSWVRRQMASGTGLKLAVAKLKADNKASSASSDEDDDE